MQPFLLKELAYLPWLSHLFSESRLAAIVLGLLWLIGYASGREKFRDDIWEINAPTLSTLHLDKLIPSWMCPPGLWGSFWGHSWVLHFPTERKARVFQHLIIWWSWWLCYLRRNYPVMANGLMKIAWWRKFSIRSCLQACLQRIKENEDEEYLTVS